MRNLFISLLAALLLTACSQSEQPTGWSIEGKINNYEKGTPLVVEYFDASGQWLAMDTVAISDDGSFSFQAMNPSQAPDLFRLRYQGRFLPVPIVSNEKLTITADGKKFDEGYKLEGSDMAKSIMAVDKIIADTVAAKGVAEAFESQGLKMKLYNDIVVPDNQGLVTYYIAQKAIGAKSLFDLSRRADVRVFSAIANKMKTILPDDPRTAAIEKLAVQGQRVTSSGKNGAKAEATLAKIPCDISLTDSNGKTQTLSEVAAKGKPVVLSFAIYSDSNAPAYNIRLQEAYNAYHAKGLEIYQVSLDANRLAWRDGARNLPWISTFFDRNDNADKILLLYNINTNGPTTFILNSEGELAERVDDVDKLTATLAKYF